MFGVQIETPLTPDALETFARHRHTQWGWEGADIYAVSIAGDRGMACGLPGLPSVTFAATIIGDGDATRAELEALARRLDPPFRYACITTYDHPGFPGGTVLPSALGGDLGHYGRITHLRVPGIYEWQVISSTHLDQLNDRPAGVTWPDGRLEIRSRPGELTGLEPLIIQSVRDAYDLQMSGAGLEPIHWDRLAQTLDPPSA
jgi:hypothetical protein